MSSSCPCRIHPPALAPDRATNRVRYIACCRPDRRRNRLVDQDAPARIGNGPPPSVVPEASQHETPRLQGILLRQDHPGSPTGCILTAGTAHHGQAEIPRQSGLLPKRDAASPAAWWRASGSRRSGGPNQCPGRTRNSFEFRCERNAGWLLGRRCSMPQSPFRGAVCDGPRRSLTGPASVAPTALHVRFVVAEDRPGAANETIQRDALATSRYRRRTHLVPRGSGNYRTPVVPAFNATSDDPFQWRHVVRPAQMEAETRAAYTTVVAAGSRISSWHLPSTR